MTLSPYIRDLRARVGHSRLILPSVSVHVFDDLGRLLLVQQREDGVWSTPGGFIEPDERPADAARREAWEEIGVVVRVERVVGVYGGPECVVRYPSGDEAQYVIIAFGCAIESGELRPDRDETVALGFHSAAEASSLTLAPWLRAALPLVYASTGQPVFLPPTWLPPLSREASIDDQAG
jgi:ADP-ribose pyrophosphatase YjhB (NUDIX family)